MNFRSLRKSKKAISCFQIEFFFLVFFSLCFFCINCFSFTLLTIIGTAKWQRTCINKVSNINKITNYDITAKSRYDSMLNFLKNCLIWSYLGVTLSTCKTQDNFCFTQVPLFSQSSNFSVVMLTDVIKYNYRLRKTNRSYTRIFPVGLDLLFSNVLKEIFVSGTSISLSFKCIVQRSRDY